METIYTYEAVYNDHPGGTLGHTGHVDANGRIVESKLKEDNGRPVERVFPACDGWVIYCYDQNGEEINLPF